MTRRYALFFSPEIGSPLDDFGRRWLRRDAGGGDLPAPIIAPGITDDRLAWITSSPRHYGFHGTLKPPFELAADQSEERFYEAVEKFAVDCLPFHIKGLVPKWIGRFLALVPSERDSRLMELADNCVRDFDVFRAEPKAEELEKRRAAGLSPRQEELLQKWGYPYVMDEFGFHFTLTGHMENESEKELIYKAAAPHVAGFADAPVRVAELCVFEQEDRKTPFIIAKRFPFGRSSSLKGAYPC